MTNTPSASSDSGTMEAANIKTGDKSWMAADAAMFQIWSEWYSFYEGHFRGEDITVSAADQTAFYEIAQPILRALASNREAQAPEAHGVGMDWKISAETQKQLDEIDSNIRNAGHAARTLRVGTTSLPASDNAAMEALLVEAIGRIHVSGGGMIEAGPVSLRDILNPDIIHKIAKIATRAALSQSQSVTVQLVPKVLTEAMLEVAAHIADGPSVTYQEHWDAMLEAALPVTEKGGAR